MAKQKNFNPAVKKQQIIDAAIKVLNKKEYFQVPMDEIAKGAGIAKGTIYLYFKSKEELYFSVLFELIDDIKNIIREVKSLDIPASKQILELLRKVSDYITRRRLTFASLRNEMKPMRDKAHCDLHDKFHEIIEEMSSIFAKGIKESEFKPYPPILMSGAFFSMASMVAHQSIEGDKTNPPIPTDMLYEMFIKGVGR